MSYWGKFQVFIYTKDRCTTRTWIPSRTTTNTRWRSSLNTEFHCLMPIWIPSRGMVGWTVHISFRSSPLHDTYLLDTYLLDSKKNEITKKKEGIEDLQNQHSKQSLGCPTHSLVMLLLYNGISPSAWLHGRIVYMYMCVLLLTKACIHVHVCAPSLQPN